MPAPAPNTLFDPPAQAVPWADGGAILAPSSGKQSLGWEAGEAPAESHFNWLHNTFSQWVAFLYAESFALCSRFLAALTSGRKLDPGTAATLTSWCYAETVHGFIDRQVGDVMAATGNAIFVTSEDGGETWANHGTGGRNYLAALHHPGFAGNAVVGFDDGGLYVTRYAFDGDTAWSNGGGTYTAASLRHFYYDTTRGVFWGAGPSGLWKGVLGSAWTKISSGAEQYGDVIVLPSGRVVAQNLTTGFLDYSDNGTTLVQGLDLSGLAAVSFAFAYDRRAGLLVLAGSFYILTSDDEGATILSAQSYSANLGIGVLEWRGVAVVTVHSPLGTFVYARGQDVWDFSLEDATIWQRCMCWWGTGSHFQIHPGKTRALVPANGDNQKVALTNVVP